MKIGFIGLGNMAVAMLGGLLKKGIVDSSEVYGASKTNATAERISKEYGIAAGTDNRKVAANAEVLVLAVKPVFLNEVISEIRDVVAKDTLIISIAAGKSIAWIEDAFAKEIKLVRCMPNTPALVLEGCTGVCINSKVSEAEQELAIKLLSSFGKAFPVEERMMDAVVGVSGSSPAYVFMFIEAMADAAVLGGMPRKMAYEFAAQAVYGSAKMVLELGKHPAELKDMVCSPGGTTIEAVRVLEEKGMRAAVIDAMIACMDKNKKL